MTDFGSKCRILGKLWLDYRDDPDFEDFIEYNDMGLPLAYLVDSNLAKSTQQGEIFVEETFDLFLQSLGLEDTGFEDLESVLEAANELPFD